MKIKIRADFLLKILKNFTNPFDSIYMELLDQINEEKRKSGEPEEPGILRMFSMDVSRISMIYGLLSDQNNIRIMDYAGQIFMNENLIKNAIKHLEKYDKGAEVTLDSNSEPDKIIISSGRKNRKLDKVDFDPDDRPGSRISNIVKLDSDVDWCSNFHDYRFKVNISNLKDLINEIKVMGCSYANFILSEELKIELENYSNNAGFYSEKILTDECKVAVGGISVDYEVKFGSFVLEFINRCMSEEVELYFKEMGPLVVRNKEDWGQIIYLVAPRVAEEEDGDPEKTEEEEELKTDDGEEGEDSEEIDGDGENPEDDSDGE
jgi:hypothetical protein